MASQPTAPYNPPMSSLIPEHQISFSPSLAATIGLEEAILLHVLSALNRMDVGQHKRDYLWHALSTEQINLFLPFWTVEDVQRIAKSLRDKGIVLLDSASLVSGRQLRFAMNERQTPDLPPTSPSVPATSAQRAARVLPGDWQPDEDLLELLALNHNIDRDFALQQVEDFVLYWRDRQRASHSWASKFRQHVLREWRHHQSRVHRANHAESMEQRWSPSPEALEILERAEIDAGFIEDAVPEFVLYWSERGVASDTWNSKFIAHIRRQWARFSATMKGDYEPRPINADWAPSEDVFDILRLANIDPAFARQLVPEFILFWRDAGEAHRSWNSKFLQHVKYQWATRHHMEPTHGGQQGHYRPANSATQGAPNSPFQRLTDRSWAEGIVDGL